MALTAKKIENAKYGGGALKLFDANGLYVELAPVGGKWWRWKYRFGEKEKRLSFGTFPDVSVRDARDARDAARKLLASGVDPTGRETTARPSRGK